MTNQGKRKVSITIDADLVEALEAKGAVLSAEMNSALRAELARKQRQQALGEFLDRLAAERGPLDTTEDEAEIARIMRLLGDTPEDPGDWVT
jgi:post-segregation antitoxin (ccd killing protein)